MKKSNTRRDTKGMNLPYWKFMHGGISKFSSELNGIYIRYLNAENNPCSFTYALTKVRGGLNAHWLAFHLIDETGDILEFQGSAFETVVSEVSKYVKDKFSQYHQIN